MNVEKWDEVKKEYTKHDVPEEWNVKSYCEDMNEIVNCVCCGKKITFGEGYTSRIYQTRNGMGYAECEECYFQKEERNN